MGSWMVLKISFPTKNLTKVMEEISHDIVVSYVFDNESEVFQTNYYSYGDPVYKYNKLKEYVHDIWYLCISDSRNLKGRNMRTTWCSAKKEYLESEEGDWDED